jgi:DNA-binding transcriptional LysR family regulator
MDSEKLNYFLEIAHQGSFSKAARRLGISQPTLSRAVKNLEERIGAQLFDRESSPIKLTAAGEALLPKVSEALGSIEEGLLAVREAVAEGDLALDIGYLPPSYQTFVGDLFNALGRSLDSVTINPHPQDAGPMLDSLRAGKLDIAFIGMICKELDSEFDSFLLWHIPLCLVVASNHSLANRDEVPLDEAGSFPLVSLSAEAFPGRHELITSLCREAGLRPGSVRRADSLLSALAMIGNSDGFSIMPSEVANIASDHVRFVNLTDPEAVVPFHAIVRKGEARRNVLAVLHEARRMVSAKIAPTNGE